MLNIYYGNMKESVYNTAAYFKYDYEDSWIVDPFVKEMIQDVDQSTVLDSGVIDSPVLGKIPPVGLSGGVKTLILVKFEKTRFLREKNTFTRSDASVLYLAGFCDWFDNERRFVILTTAANESMIKVHDRMPLILEKEQMEDWFDNEKMQVILRQEPVMLKRQAEYEQLSLFS